MQIPGGYLSDRFSVKRVLQIASFCGAFSVFGLTFTESFWQVQFYRLIMGFVSGYGFVTAIRLTTNWISTKHHGLAMGSMITFGTLGGVVSQGPMAYLVTLIGGRNTLLCVAVLGILVFILISIFVKDRPDDVNLETETQYDKYPLFRGVWEICTSKQALLICLYIGFFGTLTMLFSAVWSSKFLTAVYKLNNISANFITSMIFIGSIFGNPILGFISDKIKSRRGPMIATALLSAIIMLIINYCVFLPAVVLAVLYFILGIVLGGLCLGYPFLVESDNPKLAGLLSAVASIFVIGIPAALQPVYGMIVDMVSKAEGLALGQYSVSSFQIANLVIPIGLILGAICILFTKGVTEKLD